MQRALNPSQHAHAVCAASLRARPGVAVVSPFVLAELDDLVLTEGGVERELALLDEVAGGAYEILTLDHRHFRVVPAPDGRPFRLLPADG